MIAPAEIKDAMPARQLAFKVGVGKRDFIGLFGGDDERGGGSDINFANVNLGDHGGLFKGFDPLQRGEDFPGGDWMTGAKRSIANAS